MIAAPMMPRMSVGKIVYDSILMNDCTVLFLEKKNVICNHFLLRKKRVLTLDLNPPVEYRNSFVAFSSIQRVSIVVTNSL